MDAWLKNNETWVSEQTSKDKNYFTALSKGQKPTAFYIGCSDSRVCPETLLQTKPGEILVYRNIANQVDPKDPNCLALLEVAVDILKLKDIIICGHYNCGGINVGLSGNDYLDPEFNHTHNCVSPITELKKEFAQQLDQLTTAKEKADFLAEENVKRQVQNLLKIESVQRNLDGLNIHSWVFDIRSGKIKKVKID